MLQLRTPRTMPRGWVRGASSNPAWLVNFRWLLLGPEAYGSRRPELRLVVFGLRSKRQKKLNYRPDAVITIPAI